MRGHCVRDIACKKHAADMRCSAAHEEQQSLINPLGDDALPQSCSIGHALPKLGGRQLCIPSKRCHVVWHCNVTCAAQREV